MSDEYNSLDDLLARVVDLYGYILAYLSENVNGGREKRTKRKSRLFGKYGGWSREGMLVLIPRFQKSF